MTNLITITKNEIGNAELNSANARDIHSYLEVKTRFNDWINRAIVKYDFKENIDFVKIDNSLLKNGKRDFSDFTEKKEYIVTMDMAKELAMLENNPKGKETRKYFIACEKELQKRDLSLNTTILIELSKLNQEIKNLKKQVVSNEQNNKKLIKNKDTATNTGFKISRDFTDFYDLNYIELEILKVLIEKNEHLDKRVIDDKNYFKLTLKMMVEFSSVKTSEKTLQRHSLSLREKKVLDCVNKIDGNYLKISDEALEFLGGAR